MNWISRSMTTAILLTVCLTVYAGRTFGQVSQPQASIAAQDGIDRARELLRSKQYDKAADVLRQVIASEPESAAAQAHFSFAVLSVAQDKIAERSSIRPPPHPFQSRRLETHGHFIAKIKR